MKCSIRSIHVGDDAYAAERDRLQCAGTERVPAHDDPLLRAMPRPSRRMSEVEMLLNGLREIEREGEC